MKKLFLLLLLSPLSLAAAPRELGIVERVTGHVVIIRGFERFLAGVGAKLQMDDTVVVEHGEMRLRTGGLLVGAASGAQILLKNPKGPDVYRLELIHGTIRLTMEDLEAAEGLCELHTPGATLKGARLDALVTADKKTSVVALLSGRAILDALNNPEQAAGAGVRLSGGCLSRVKDGHLPEAPSELSAEDLAAARAELLLASDRLPNRLPDLEEAERPKRSYADILSRLAAEDQLAAVKEQRHSDLTAAAATVTKAGESQSENAAVLKAHQENEKFLFPVPLSTPNRNY